MRNHFAAREVLFWFFLLPSILSGNLGLLKKIGNGCRKKATPGLYSFGDALASEESFVDQDKEWSLCFNVWAERALVECPPILEKRFTDHQLVNEKVSNAIFPKSLTVEQFPHYRAFRAWVIRVAWNDIRRALGKSKKVLAGDWIDDEPAEEDEVPAGIISEFLQPGIRMVLTGLNAQDRMVLILNPGFHPKIQLQLSAEEERQFLFEPFPPDQQRRISEIIAKRRPVRQKITDKDIGYILVGHDPTADEKAENNHWQKAGNHRRLAAERHFVKAVERSKILEDLDQLGGD